MNEHSYTTFTLNNLRYGVETIFIEEIFYLPEITPIPEAPSDIIGVLNLRGNIVPIMDLNYRFGYAPSEYCLNDSVIILRWADLRVGIIVNEVHEVKSVLSLEITSELSYDHTIVPLQEERFVAGIARTDSELLILLSLEKLLRYLASQNLDLEEIHQENDTLYKQTIFCPNATTDERETFRKRTENLKESIEKEELINGMPLAVVEIGDEYFGIDLNQVREFTEISKISPIPCSPHHIIGQTNIRGEIITLIDISRFLKLPHLKTNQTQKAMIVDVEGLVAGIGISKICNVIQVDRQQIASTSTASTVIQDEYLQGILLNQESTIGLLNLSKIFEQIQN